MKKILVAAAFCLVPAVLNAGELVIVEKEGSQVSLKAKDNQLSVNGAALPTAVLVGRDPAANNQIITIGSVVGSDGDQEFKALIEYEGKKYAVEMASSGVRVFGSDLYSDSNCQTLVGSYYAFDNAIVAFRTNGAVSLYSVDVANPMPVGATVYYLGFRDKPSECYEFNENSGPNPPHDWVFPYTKLPISEQELLKGAVAPYSVVYK